MISGISGKKNISYSSNSRKVVPVHNTSEKQDLSSKDYIDVEYEDIVSTPVEEIILDAEIVNEDVYVYNKQGKLINLSKTNNFKNTV